MNAYVLFSNKSFTRQWSISLRHFILFPHKNHLYSKFFYSSSESTLITLYFLLLTPPKQKIQIQKRISFIQSSLFALPKIPNKNSQFSVRRFFLTTPIVELYKKQIWHLFWHLFCLLTFFIENNTNQFIPRRVFELWLYAISATILILFL